MSLTAPSQILRHTKVPSLCIGSCKSELAKTVTAGTRTFCNLAHRLSPTTLAPTQKSIYSPLHSSTSAIIASQRSEAITRHLSTGSQSQPPTMSYGKGSEFTYRQIAPKHTLDYRCYIERDGVPLSPFHDVPLYANEQQTILNMVVEIPRWTNAKLEVGQTQNQVETMLMVSDLQRRIPQPNKARHQEGQASLRPQLLPTQGLPLELRCLPQGM